MINLKKTEIDELEELTSISKRAFDSDISIGASCPEGGPPGFDDVSWHRRMMRISEGFYSVYNDDMLIGGILVFREGSGIYNLGRIWLDPSIHKKGFGLDSMNALMDMYPDAVKWKLETPLWNTRTRNFYLKAGFSIIGENSDDVFFEKYR